MGHSDKQRQLANRLTKILIFVQLLVWRMFLCMFVHLCSLKYWTDFDGTFTGGWLIYPGVTQDMSCHAILSVVGTIIKWPRRERERELQVSFFHLNMNICRVTALKVVSNIVFTLRNNTFLLYFIQEDRKWKKNLLRKYKHRLRFVLILANDNNLRGCKNSYLCI